MSVAVKDLMKPVTDEQADKLAELVAKSGLHPAPYVRTRGLAAYWITRLEGK